MDKGKLFIASLLILVLLTGVLLAACGSSTASSGSVASALDGPTLLQQRCTQCHDISQISMLHGTPDQWKSLVDAMISRGAHLNSQEEQTLVNYLSQSYP